MSRRSSKQWQQEWEKQAGSDVSDFSLDRAAKGRDEETDRHAEQELLEFIEPQPHERVLDAGCGTGVNLVRLHRRVQGLVGMDYSRGMLLRAQARLGQLRQHSVCLLQGSGIQAPFRESSFDRILCLSVLQYLDDDEVRRLLDEFARVARDGGVIILHVKNLSSLYLSTLLLAKKIRRLLGGKEIAEHLRTKNWYLRELRKKGCTILGFNSFNFLLLEGMPARFAAWLRSLEIRHRKGWFFASRFVRSHGSELKIKARIRKGRGKPVSRQRQGRLDPAGLGFIS